MYKDVDCYYLQLKWWWSGKASLRRWHLSQDLKGVRKRALRISGRNAFQVMKVKVAQLCPTLCDPMDYTVHGILQARILEWVAFPFSRGSSQPRDQTQVSCIAGGFFTSWATREAQKLVLKWSEEIVGVGVVNFLQSWDFWFIVITNLKSTWLLSLD